MSNVEVGTIIVTTTFTTLSMNEICLCILPVGQFTNKSILLNRTHLTERQINRSRHKYFCCLKGFAYFGVKQLLPDAKVVHMNDLFAKCLLFHLQGWRIDGGGGGVLPHVLAIVSPGVPWPSSPTWRGVMGDLPLLRFVLSFCNFHLFSHFPDKLFSEH